MFLTNGSQCVDQMIETTSEISEMPLLRGAEDLGQFIGKNYSGRVVEIGAGHILEVALYLAEPWSRCNGHR